MTSATRRLAIGGLAMLSFSVLQRCLGLLSVTVLARILEARGLGAYNFTASSSQTFQGLSRLGIDTGLHVELAGSLPHVDKVRIENALGEAFGLTLGVTLVVAALMIGLAGFIADRLFAAPELAPFMKIAAVLMFGQCFAQICYIGFAGLNAFPTYSRIAIIGAIISVVAVVIGAVGAGAQGAAVGLAASQLITSTLLFTHLKRQWAQRDLVLRLRVPNRQALRLLKVGLPYYLGTLLLFPCEFYVLGLLSRSAGVDVLGQLRVVQAIIAIIAVLPGALFGPLVTYLSERHAAGQGTTAFSLQLRLIWSGSLLLAISLASIFPLPIWIIFGRQFALAGTIGVLAIGPLLGTILLGLLQSNLMAQRKSLGLFLGGAIMAGCLVGVASVLTPKYGLVGHFVSQGVSYGVGAAFSGMWLFHTSGSGLRLNAKLVLLTATAMTLGLLALAAMGGLEWQTRIAASMGGLALVLAWCWLWVFSSDERKRLIAFARKGAKSMSRSR